MEIIHKNDPEFDGSDYVQTQSKKDSKIKFMSISVCACVFFFLCLCYPLLDLSPDTFPILIIRLWINIL
jgi:hypothetical protein